MLQAPEITSSRFTLQPRYLWLLGTALALLAMHSNWAVPLAAWVFPVFLLRYTRANTPWRGTLRVWLSLMVVVLVWLTVTGLVFALTAVAAFTFLAALHAGAFLLDRVVAPRLPALLGTLVFPLALAGAELLFVLIGQFGSFGLLGSTQYGTLPLLQLASVTGVYGISFLVAWFASVATWVWEQGFDWPRVRRAVFGYLAVLAVVFAAGGVRLLVLPPTTETVRVAGISPSWAATAASREALNQLNVHQWRPTELLAADQGAVRTALGKVTDDLLTRTAAEAAAGAKVILWPETHAGIMEHDQSAVLRRAETLAQQHNVYINLAYALYTNQAPNVRNISTLVTPQRGVAWTYDKTHPTPMEPMTPGVGDVPVADSPYGRLASVICYDADFPDLMRQAAGKGTDLMLVPANDWVGFEYLHAELATFRAVENGYPLLRQSTHGLGTAVDHQGRLLALSNSNTADQQPTIAQIPLQPRVHTIYSTVGDVFGWLCIGGTVLLAGFAFRRRTGSIS